MNERIKGVASHFKLVWSYGEKLGTLASLILLLAMILGFRIDRPSDRLAKLESADSAMTARIKMYESETAPMKQQVSMLVRQQCLSMTRVQTVTLNVPECDAYKTADDTMARHRGR
jgi:hypothetical protein